MRLTHWVFAFLFLAAPVFAAPTAKELSKARAQFQQATELEQAGNFTSALDMFRQVGQVKMTPQVRYHIAHCEEKLGRLLVALGGYELAASDAAKVDPSFEREVVARADELRARIPKLAIKRGSNAEAAQIELDGVALGDSSIGTELTVDPGPHEVKARASGREPFSATVTLAEHDLKTVEVTFANSAATKPETVPENKAAKPDMDRGPEPKQPSHTLAYVVGGVGVASLAASGVFFLMKQSAVSQLEDQCGPNHDKCPASSQSTYDHAKLYNTLSGVTLGVGVVGVGVAATLLLTSKPATSEKATSGVRLVPSAPNAHTGLSFVGAF